MPASNSSNDNRGEEQAAAAAAAEDYHFSEEDSGAGTTAREEEEHHLRRQGGTAGSAAATAAAAAALGDNVDEAEEGGEGRRGSPPADLSHREDLAAPVSSPTPPPPPAESYDDDDGYYQHQSSFFPDLDSLRYWSHPDRSSAHMESRQQGVLWKRRDVFRNRWRPRWFVLQPGQRILTYYLLTTDQQPGAVAAAAAATTTTVAGGGTSATSRNDEAALRAVPPGTASASAPAPSSSAAYHWNAAGTGPSRAAALPGPSEGGINSSGGGGGSSRNDLIAGAPAARGNSRSRASSYDSLVSENSVDYDVVPRGTIYLLGCTVSANDALTKAEESLYAFTIAPPSSAAGAVDGGAGSSRGAQKIHLAARSAQSRAVWIEKIARVCGGPSPRTGGDGNGNFGRVADALAAISAMSEDHGSGGDAQQQEQRLQQQAQQPAAGQRRPPLPPSRETNGVSGTDALAGPGAAAADAADAGAAAANSGSAVTGQQQRQRLRATAADRSWTSAGDASELYANLSDSLAERIKAALQLNLAVCDQPPDSSEWKILYRNETSSAFQRRSSSKVAAAMIKTVSLLDHPPKQVFRLLVDATRRGDVEKNIREARVLRVLNNHTTLGCYRYDAIWPASPREFAVVTHWQVVGKGTEKAIVLVSFSCDEAAEEMNNKNNAGPGGSSKGYVRGTLYINLSLLRNAGHDDQCHFTRILSYNLGGGAGGHFSSVIIKQQAGFPSLLAGVLQRNEPEPDARVKGCISDDVLQRDIVQRQTSYREGGGFRRPLADDERTGSDLEEDAGDVVVDKSPRLEKVALLLFLPVMLHRLLVHISGPYPALCFLVSSFLVVREVILLHEGEVVPWLSEQQLIGPVTFTFKVDLKGVLRFIANKKEERRDHMTGSAEISVVHILACAVATALKKEENLHLRRVSVPWLCIDQFVKAASEPVSVSIWESSKRFITLNRVDASSVQTIADEMARVPPEGRNGSDARPGSCLILAAPNSDSQDCFDTSAVPEHPDVRVLAVIGGVYLDPLPRRSSMHSHRQGPRPVLQVSITVAPSPQADFVTCRSFVEEIQKLLQFPEICDG